MGKDESARLETVTETYFGQLTEFERKKAMKSRVLFTLILIALLAVK